MIWRVGILYRSVELIELIARQPSTENEISRSFENERFHNVRIADILKICHLCKWIERKGDNKLYCTEHGRKLISCDSPPSCLKIQITCLLEKDVPAWASTATQGRRALVNYAPPEAVQCFREAGLLNSDDDNTVKWWDNLICRFRAVQDEANVHIGRVGEKLTIDYEKRRTGKKPHWVALEYSCAGYDIVSCLSKDDSRSLIIEVKTSSLSWSHARFFLSRNEWDTLSLNPHSVIHLWSTHCTPASHAIITIPELKPHVPLDVGAGLWEKCVIPFAQFSENSTGNDC